MYLSNHEAVTLVQVLAVYADNHLSAGTSDFQRAVDALRKRVEDELTGDPRLGELRKAAEDGEFSLQDLLDDEDEEPNDEEAEDDEREEEDAAGEEDSTEREEPGEGDEPPEEAASPASEARGSRSSEESLRADCRISSIKLAKLRDLSSEEGNLKLEWEDDVIVLNNDGRIEAEPVTHLKRFAKELHVRDGESEWAIYNVKKFPSAWTKALPVRKLVEVV